MLRTPQKGNWTKEVLVDKEVIPFKTTAGSSVMDVC